tara:strand:- start:341 stop:601 length:261 start_codon:yes stop_codon:yes gene_type:complete
MSDDLVKRLRDVAGVIIGAQSQNLEEDYGLAREAADRIEKLEAALSLAQDWIENRAIHAGDLCTSNQCVCGKALVLFNARKALDAK